MKDLAFILDIGSSKISLLACQVKKGKSSIITCIDKSYDGFMDGEFFSVEQVSETVGSLISAMSSQLNMEVSNIHVGLSLLEHGGNAVGASACAEMLEHDGKAEA